MRIDTLYLSIWVSYKGHNYKIMLIDYTDQYVLLNGGWSVPFKDLEPVVLTDKILAKNFDRYEDMWRVVFRENGKQYVVTYKDNILSIDTDFGQGHKEFTIDNTMNELQYALYKGTCPTFAAGLIA